MPGWCGSFPAKVAFSLLAAISVQGSALTLASTASIGRSWYFCWATGQARDPGRRSAWARAWLLWSHRAARAFPFSCAHPTRPIL